MKIRCFFSLEPPLQIRKKISVFIDTERSRTPGLKWVKSEALHITLKFCGQIEEETAGTLAEKFKEAIDRETLKPFPVQLSGFGVFPNARRASVLWLGVNKGQARLKHIHDLVEKCTFNEGVPAEKRSFHPHITIARARRGSCISQALTQKCLESCHNFGAWNASEITMMKSELYPGGPVYTPLASFELS